MLNVIIIIWVLLHEESYYVSQRVRSNFWNTVEGDNETLARPGVLKLDSVHSCIVVYASMAVSYCKVLYAPQPLASTNKLKANNDKRRDNMILPYGLSTLIHLFLILGWKGFIKPASRLYSFDTIGRSWGILLFQDFLY